MEYKDISDKLVKMKNEDLKLREKLMREESLSDGYHPLMEELHDKHALIMDEIIDLIGLPTEKKVGPDGVEASWLIIQHSINHPKLMKRYLGLLEDEESIGIHYAYLYDRIAVFEDRLQMYGTQFDWDSGGYLSPYPYDDLDQVNERRKALSLNTLDEQVNLMRKSAEESNQQPPKNHEERRKKYNKWRKDKGWI